MPKPEGPQGPDFPARPVRQFFTSRRGGVSPSPYDSFNLGDHVGDHEDNVRANRARLARLVGLDEQNLVWMEQIHSPNITVVEYPTDQPVPATDALITATPKLGMCVLVADCVPVLLSDSQAPLVAAVHAGRMGARNGIVRRTVERMVELGAIPSRMHALIGPAASGDFYEVPEAMAADVERHLSGARTTTLKQTPGLDLRAGIINQLYALGVRSIDCDHRCTISDQQFFSYRRDGNTGRQAGVIYITS
ncbi:peptidoglycan editing factor PgeF [Corynebacterium sp. ES2794-CONJ1]|uniref:peptidoglycan editing factor PgeF n=1 Tax=Corynebacterium sp. ES2794-CONJ1 TaxID=2980553 RepID=UPI0021D8DD6D|nr:peptidoglycan editing factor PgeF [Corynebacterium sp. ES2794-CONJ1]MCU9518654.1 peptidoglycan editing factor PgeF [Corynebacterium sp. ES2794-CONJ1]